MTDDQTETLRRAASLMRERAEAARHTTALTNTDTWGAVISGVVNGSLLRDEKEHAASWHPDVALAVADLLTAFSMMPSASDPTDLSAALRVARAYLKENPDA